MQKLIQNKNKKKKKTKKKTIGRGKLLTKQNFRENKNGERPIR